MENISKGNKLKKDLVNKKLQKIKESDIKINFEEDKEFAYITIEINSLLCPAERPRSSSKFSGLYDPLQSYKENIRKRLKEISNVNYKYSGYAEVELELYVKYLGKSKTAKNELYARKGILKPISKPDLDNVEKTIYDALNDFIWIDDAQIISSKTKKIFAEDEKSIFKIKIQKEVASVEGRLNKEEKEELIKLQEEQIWN